MPGYVIGNFLIYAIINAFTPGPGNFLALNTVGNYGWRRGRPLFFGIFLGYYVVQIICALVIFLLGAMVPEVLVWMKYIGAAYIIWLAIHIAVSRPPEETDDSTASFWKGFLLQFVNVKIYLFGLTALTGFITDYSTAFPALLIAELVIASIGTIATLTWIGLGTLMRKAYLKHFRVVNIILALALLECVWSILRV